MNNPLSYTDPSGFHTDGEDEDDGGYHYERAYFDSSGVLNVVATRDPFTDDYGFGSDAAYIISYDVSFGGVYGGGYGGDYGVDSVSNPGDMQQGGGQGAMLPGSGTVAGTALGIGVGIAASFIPGSGIPDALNAYRNGSYALAGILLATELPILKQVKTVVTVLRGITRLAKTRRLGREGEAAVRAAYDIGDKARLSINGRTRIPDGLKSGQSLSEVKNVANLSFNKQLRDYSDYAQAEGLRFDLYACPNTQLSGPLKDAIDSGLFNRLYIPS